MNKYIKLKEKKEKGQKERKEKTPIPKKKLKITRSNKRPTLLGS